MATPCEPDRGTVPRAVPHPLYLRAHMELVVRSSACPEVLSCVPAAVGLSCEDVCLPTQRDSPGISNGRQAQQLHLALSVVTEKPKNSGN